MEFLVVIGVFVFFIVGVVKISGLESKIRQLEWRLRQLGDDFQKFKLDHKETPITPQQTNEPSIQAPVEVSQQQRIPEVQIPQLSEPASQEVSLPVPPVPDEQEWKPIKPSRTKEEWEAFIGGKLLNRIGALALIIGVGFFLKYAFDNNWISETVRVLIGGFAGLILLYGAHRTNAKGFQIFSQGLVGAGTAILYLSVYAAFNFYNIISQPVAFTLMAIVTLLTFLQALKYDSLTVSLLGWAGGFMTPFMLSTGHANETGLFTYIALLDAGMLAVVLTREDWIILEPLSLIATYVTFYTWFQVYYTPGDLVPTAFFLTVFWLLFFGCEFWRNSKKFGNQSELRSVVGAFSGLLYYGLLYRILDVEYDKMMPLVTLGIGAIYFGSALYINSLHGDDTGPIAQYALSAMALLVIATAIQCTNLFIALFWALEALVLLLCGVRWKIDYVWKFSLLLFALTFVKLVAIDGSIYYSPITEFTLLLNKRALAYAVFALSTAAAALFFDDENEKTVQQVTAGLHYAWSTILLILCIVEVNDYFGVMRYYTIGGATTIVNFHEGLWLAAICMGYSRFVMEFGLKNRINALIHSGSISLILSVIIILISGATYIPIEFFQPVFNIRAGLYLFIILGLMMHVKSVRGFVDSMPWLNVILKTMEIAFFVLIFALLSVETIDFFERKIRLTDEASLIQHWMNMRQMSLSVVWLMYSIVLMVLGIWRQVRGLRVVSFVLFAVTILKIFIYDLSFLETLYRIISFIGLGLILLAVSYLYQRYKEQIFGIPAAKG